MSMLNIENLSVEYERRGRQVRAVRDVSFTVDAGETVGLVGESGSGKSTVALSILRLIRPHEGRITSGRVVFDGQDLLGLPEEAMRRIRGHRIAMIFQDPFTALNPVMTIRAQMREVLDRGLDKNAGTLSLENALALVKLEPKRTLDAYPHQLSGGQRQRVLLATAMLGQPELLLADEPTTALDVIVQKEILDLLFGLQKEFKTGLLFISHNLALVAHYAQRMIVMKDGQIVESGTSRELFQRPEHPYTQMLLAAVPRRQAK